MNKLLIGKDSSPIIAIPGESALVHHDVLAPYLEMKAKAAKEGIDLCAVSGFRDYHRQLFIWNKKARGELAVLDDQGNELDLEKMSNKEKIWAILRYSALPGASRHHWGTELDIYDRSKLPPKYRLQLTQKEVQELFPALHRWLDLNMKSCGFYRPYNKDLKGVATEPWHVSYLPLAASFQHQYTLEIFRQVIASSDIELKDTVINHLEEIFNLFVMPPIVGGQLGRLKA